MATRKANQEMVRARHNGSEFAFHLSAIIEVFHPRTVSVRNSAISNHSSGLQVCLYNVILHKGRVLFRNDQLQG